MGRFLNALLKEKYNTDKLFSAEYKSIFLIRDQIINSLYLISGIFGTIAIINTFIGIIKSGFQVFYIFQIVLYAAIWWIYFLRKKISLHFKALFFIIVFFILATSINYKFGVISGALNFVFITTLVTLILGWKAGVISIIFTLLVRLCIGICYLKGVLKYDIDFNSYVQSPAAVFTNIMGGLVIASITVFVINTFYIWLLRFIRTTDQKTKELSEINQELLNAKLKAEEHDRLKSVFLANMSHEIRTPMNAIIGFSAVLTKPNLSEEKRNKYVSIIHERSYDLLRIIEDILDISKLEVGQMKLIESSFQLSSMMAEIHQFYNLKGNQKYPEDIQLKYVVSDELRSLQVFYDKQRLNQIFTNLLDNAYKFTKKGEIEYGCRLHTGNNILFWVKDTGIGIPKDKQEIIFDRFRQVDDTLPVSQYGGTGLGLSIVLGIVKLMKGTIWVESELDLGTTFYFTLPLKTLS